MLQRAIICLAFTILALVLPVQARAASLLFELTGPQTASFTLPAAPLPDVVLSDGFTLTDVAVVVEGQDLVRDVSFANALNGGGLIISGTAIDLTGAQLFSGSFFAPTLLQGQFSLTGVNSPPLYSLRVGPALAPVPEPSTWLLLLLGFGAIGAAMRRPGFSEVTNVVHGSPARHNG